MKRKEQKKEISCARVNLVLYIVLLIITPFLLVRNYLQAAIGRLSQWSFSFGKFDIPYVLSALFIFLIALMAVNFRRLRGRYFMSAAAALILMAVGQSSTDYYFNHDFYELQHNWHYFAYGIFTWVYWLYYRQKSQNYSRFLWQAFFTAAFISVLDETAQIFISSRVFDICDIGKDLWGTVIGLTVISIVTKPEKKKTRLLHRNLRENLRHTWSILLLMLIFGIIFLNISSLLTTSGYIDDALLWTLIIFIPAIVILYFLQFQTGRIIFIILFIAGAVYFYSSSARSPEIITQSKPGLLKYKSLPIPFFDVMLYSDGGMRLVDKKIFFNEKDKTNRIYGLCEDILLIGTGSKGQGGKGFKNESAYFDFNYIKKKPLQILIYPNQQAMKIYRELRNDGKKVLFIIHNS